MGARVPESRTRTIIVLARANDAGGEQPALTTSWLVGASLRDAQGATIMARMKLPRP